MSKIITVFGATGTQGGSVVKAILADPALSKEYSVRGVTRDVNKANAQALAKQGVSLVTADLDSKESISKAIEGSHTIFLVTNFWEKADPKIEKAQGVRVTDAAREAGVKFIIFSSLLNVSKLTNGKLSHVVHFDTKAEIEDYIRSSGIPCAFVMAGYYMSNYPQMLLQKQDDGSFSLAYPISKQAKFPLVDTAEDLGKFVKPLLKQPDVWKGKQILAATDYYPLEQILSEFEEASGKKIQFNQVTADQYKSFLPPFMAEEMLENHLFIEEPGYFNGRSLQESLNALDSPPTTWKEFVKKNF